MKINFYLSLLVVFIAISVWLSFKVKSLNKKLNYANTKQINITKENKMFKYHHELITEVLEINIKNHPSINSGKISLNNEDNDQTIILYLKANSCTSCNISTVSAMIENFSNNKNFAIVSHTTNKAFIQSFASKEIEPVHYVEDKFIQENNPIYDAEILIIDRNYSILGRLPLELLKEFELFESLFEKIASLNK
jgi:Fe-S cluster biogenesis protein NfuA